MNFKKNIIRRKGEERREREGDILPINTKPRKGGVHKRSEEGERL